MRRSSSLSLSTWFSFSLDSRCPFFSCLSDFSPVRTRRGGHTAADPRTGGEPPVHPSRPEDAGFSPSGRPSQSRWVSCRLPGNGHHSGMAPLQGLISLRQGKKGKLAVACPPPNSRADCNVDVGPGVETAKSRISLHLGQRNNVQGTKYYSVSLPRHFHFQATSLVPDSQRPSRFSISLQVHLQCCCRSPAVDPSLFSRLLGAGECFFGPLLCDGTRGNKFRPIAPYATDWCLK